MSNFENDWILSCAMDRLSTPRILGYVPFIHLRWWTLFHRAWNRTRTIIHSPVKTMIIFALQLYIEEIIGEESAPKGVNQPLVEGAQKQRTIVIFPFPPEEVVHDFHLLLLFLSSLLFSLFRAKPRRISSMKKLEG